MKLNQTVMGLDPQQANEWIEALKQVVLEITTEHAIARILLYGTDDSITEYRFSNQKENVALPDAKFRFSPPPGTEVIVDDTGK